MIESSQQDLASANDATAVRVVWMRAMGLDEDEIVESIRDDPPKDVQLELKELWALECLAKNMPPHAELRKYAVKYD